MRAAVEAWLRSACGGQRRKPTRDGFRGGRVGSARAPVGPRQAPQDMCQQRTESPTVGPTASTPHSIPPARPRARAASSRDKPRRGAWWARRGRPPPRARRPRRGGGRAGGQGNVAGRGAGWGAHCTGACRMPHAARAAAGPVKGFFCTAEAGRGSGAPAARRPPVTPPCCPAPRPPRCPRPLHRHSMEGRQTRVGMRGAGLAGTCAAGAGTGAASGLVMPPVQVPLCKLCRRLQNVHAMQPPMRAHPTRRHLRPCRRPTWKGGPPPAAAAWPARKKNGQCGK